MLKLQEKQTLTAPLSMLALLLGALGCGSSPDTGSTGGSKPGANLEGLLVLNSDYTSTSVSLVAADGEVLSPLFISSAGATPGLSAALSGDVALANSDAADEVVLLDRSKAVLSFVGIESATVRAQLNVGTGFNSNPQDYIPLSASKAYVPRLASNLKPGQEDYDSGDDVLVIDPSGPKVIGSIDLKPALAGVDAGFAPAAGQGLVAGGKARILLAGLKRDFSDAAPARIVTIDPSTDQISHTLVLEGMRNCTTLAMSPNGAELAVACHGFFTQDPNAGWPDAGVVLLTVGDELTRKAHYAADQFKHASSGFAAQPSGLTYVDDKSLLVATFGVSSGGPQKNVNYPAMAVSVNTTDTETSSLFEAGAFDLGHPRCFIGACFIPDAGTDGGVLRQFEIGADGSLTAGAKIAADTQTKLPPRRLQRY